MIDYNKPWGWGNTGKPNAQAGNSIAPLGGANQEGAPTPVVTGPSTEDQLISQVGGALANKAVDGAAKGLGEYMKAGDAADALATSDIGVGAASAGAGAASSALGPLGAAVGGAMKGEYDEAAGAALGSVLGAYFGPLGSMAGSKFGGMAGNALGSAFGLADGTSKVPDKKPGIVQSIWDRMVAKGAEAVQASTGNAGGLGNAKQALKSRKERLEDEEKKALGYAWGTSNVGGKGAPMAAAQGDTVLNRPFGSTAPTGYYGAAGSAPQANNVTRYVPGAFNRSNQPAPIAAAPGVGSNPVWGGGFVESMGGDGVGGGNSAGDSSSGSGIGNGAEGDSAGPGGDAGAGGGGGGGK